MRINSPKLFPGTPPVTRNKDDFITLTVQAFENTSPHYGLVVVSHSIPGSDFERMAGMLEKCAKKNPGGMVAYTIELITKTQT